jgi:hypothetical protein
VAVPAPAVTAEWADPPVTRPTAWKPAAIAAATAAAIARVRQMPLGKLSTVALRW